MSEVDNTEINIACASDDNFAQHLCVTFLSAIENLHPDCKIRFLALDCGISEEKKQKIINTLSVFKQRCRINFIKIDTKQFEHFKETHTVSRAMYARIIIGDIFPELNKVLYLDSDIVVEGDVSTLYETDFHGKVLCAVQDPNLQLAANYRALMRHVATHSYFNSGVLLLDLQAYRNAKIAEKVFLRLRTNPSDDDQTALNATLVDLWFPLEPKWNFLAALSFRKDSRYTPYNKKELQEAVAHPQIIHFASPFVKPWLYESIGPFKKRYFYYLHKTAFKNYVPFFSILGLVKKVLYIIGYEMLPDSFLNFVRQSVFVDQAMRMVARVR